MAPFNIASLIFNIHKKNLNILSLIIQNSMQKKIRKTKLVFKFTEFYILPINKQIYLPYETSRRIMYEKSIFNGLFYHKRTAAVATTESRLIAKLRNFYPSTYCFGLYILLFLPSLIMLLYSHIIFSLSYIKVTLFYLLIQYIILIQSNNLILLLFYFNGIIK